jgi:asparagine synthase (glutamine-hydrolysing)
MCGICGIVASAGLPDPQAARLGVDAMLQALSHRGPDAVASVATDSAVLGMTRLTIRGLEAVSQPMVDAETGVVAVCNGELDNHHELRLWLQERGRPVRHKTDVAVIPGLFLELGENFLRKLVGAFAIAIWDPRTRTLTLARDRAGERHLFYTLFGNEVIFATELAALVPQVHPPTRLDQAGLRKYLQLGVFPSPDTPFAAIRKVAPGELVVVEGSEVRRERYWRWRNVETPKQPPSLDAFDATFRLAVGRQTDVDVDFGVFLSGGVDSSLVSAVVRALHPLRRIKAYTLRFEEPSFDEGNFAEAVARRLDMDPVTVLVHPEDMQREVRTLVRLVGEPLADPAWLPAALLARRAAQDVKVALVGEGADELFGGYPTYIGAGLAERFARLPPWARSLFRRAVEALPPSQKKVTISFLLKRFVQGTDLEGMARHCLWVSNIAPALLRRLGVAPPDLASAEAGVGHLLDQVQRWDLETMLAEGLLTKADRASMSSALELRAPFLDEQVMEFAKSLPLSERIKGFTTKVFLKRYALRYLPHDIVHRRKRGLSVPIGRWLRGPLRDWAAAALGSGRLDQVGISTVAAQDLFAEHCERKADHARALWALLVLNEWLDWVGRRTPNDAPPPVEAPAHCVAPMALGSAQRHNVRP